MERIKTIKESILNKVLEQTGHLDKVNAKELGEAVDMIKDLAETEYYCSIVKAMEDKEKEVQRNYYYTEKYYPIEDYYKGQMYYPQLSTAEPDNREGRSGKNRKMYMESKELHHDTQKKIQELDDYMKELTNDIMEMIQDASPEEKAVLQKKINILATKLQNV